MPTTVSTRSRISHGCGRGPQAWAAERYVLHLRYVEDLTQTQIAEHVGVSQMQVSRILRRAVAQLQEMTDAASFA